MISGTDVLPKIRHYPIDRVSTLNFGRGFLCNCGRTIVGESRVLYHFGEPFDKLEEKFNGKGRKAGEEGAQADSGRARGDDADGAQAEGLENPAATEA